MPRTYARTPAIERLMPKLTTDDNGCWIFTGGLRGDGYGQILDWGEDGRRRMALAHRVTYEHFVGPIPEGLTLDHLCRVPACANPAHLEPVTLRVNILRGIGPAAIHAQKTHCQQGHEFTEGNTYRHRGQRKCRACQLAANRRWWAMHRDEINALRRAARRRLAA